MDLQQCSWHLRGQIAFLGAILYLVLGILPQREAFASVNWSIVFMVAFGIAMSSALVPLAPPT